MKIEPCPWCGGRCEAITTDDDFWYVDCTECIHETGAMETKKEVVAKHNAICRAHAKSLGAGGKRADPA